MSSSSANSSPDTGDGGGGTMGIYPRPSVSAQHLQQHQTYPLPQQQQQQQQHTKRTRVLLSCAPCRGSKLKCDRATPCGQCTKRGRPDACAYAPRPEKPGRPAKSMAARLKRLEGMVRGMIDADGNPIIASADAPPGTTGPMGAGAPAAQGLTTPASPPPPPPPMDAGGIVVQGQRATNYVGATHFMAILDDVSLLIPGHVVSSLIMLFTRSRTSRTISKRMRTTTTKSTILTRTWGRRSSSLVRVAPSRIRRSF